MNGERVTQVVQARLVAGAVIAPDASVLADVAKAALRPHRLSCRGCQAVTDRITSGGSALPGAATDQGRR